MTPIQDDPSCKSHLDRDPRYFYVTVYRLEGVTFACLLACSKWRDTYNGWYTKETGQLCRSVCLGGVAFEIPAGTCVILMPAGVLCFTFESQCTAPGVERLA